MAKTLKKWQGWALFIGSMVVVFLLGLLVSSLMERRAEVASVFNNKRMQLKGQANVQPVGCTNQENIVSGQRSSS